MQNILVFRFANRFIEPVLRAAHVDEIQITVAETLGVEGRSRYYDGIGALRDMIQNHLVQMMTFATMEPPALWDAEMLRDHKVEVLKAVRARRSRDRRRARAVHAPGSSKVSRASRTRPSRASIRRRAPTRSPRCVCTSTRGGGRACPVLLRSGKRLAAKAHEVAYRFREPPTRLFRHTPLEHAEPNWLVFRMSPFECTELVVRTKQPGLDLEARESVLRAEYTERRRPSRRPRTSSCCSTCSKAITRRSCASTRSSGRGASSIRCSKRGSTGAPEDYVAGSDGPAGQHRFLGPGHSWRPLVPARLKFPPRTLPVVGEVGLAEVLDRVEKIARRRS